MENYKNDEIYHDNDLKKILADNPKVKMKIENDELLLDF